MKLEIKNLTSYKLGKYGIKVILNEDAMREIWDIDADNSYLKDLYYISSIDYDNNLLQLVSVVNGKYGLDDIEINMISLVLYPFSMLTQEIEYNGDKFVPIEKLYEGRAENKVIICEYGNKETITASFKMMGDSFTDIIVNRKSVENTDYWIVQQLLEWHFDIYGLIEKGLAIDKTTLNKKK